MKLSCIPVGLALAATLALPPSGAFAATGELHAMSEAEMSDAYGRGLSEPTLNALGALTTQEQSSSAVSASADALAALGMLPTDGLQAIDRQLAQQRVQTATLSLQTTLKITQTLLALATALAPLSNNVTLPAMPFPLLSLPSINAIQNKH
jgi:hypothetical protein